MYVKFMDDVFLDDRNLIIGPREFSHAIYFIKKGNFDLQIEAQFVYMKKIMLKIFNKSINV